MIRQVGLLGGTFDPVHCGHLQLARVVRESCRLDKVLFIPAAKPPHKDCREMCHIRHRFQMLCDATRDLAWVQVSELEIQSQEVSYTIDTLRTLKQQTSDHHEQHHFILGHDAFLEIETWKCWRDVLRLVNFLIVLRRGFPTQSLETVLKRNGYKHEKVNKFNWYHHEYGTTITLLTPQIDTISSSDIRARIAEGRPWRHLVPDSTAAYITTHSLYQS